MRCLCGCGKEAGYKVNNGRADKNNPKRFCDNRHFQNWQKMILRKKEYTTISQDQALDEMPLYNPTQRKVMFEMARKGNVFVREKLKEMGITSIYDEGVMVQI